MVTTLYAAILALFYIGLTAFVIQGRWKYHVGIGDGKIPELAQRVRMHGNFAEHAPFALFLIFLVDYSNYAPVVVHVLGILLVLGRALHAWGLHRSAYASFGRTAGMVLTITILLACAILLSWHYFAIAATQIY